MSGHLLGNEKEAQWDILSARSRDTWRDIYWELLWEIRLACTRGTLLGSL